MLQTVCLVLLFIIRVRIHATVTKLEDLLEMHKGVKEDLASYIQNEEKKLSFVKWNLDIFKREHEIAMKDIPGYIGNPINAFRLIKRLTSDLKYLRESVTIPKVNIRRANVIYPTQEELAGAAQNLAKLLETHELDVKELSEGNINGSFSRYSTQMTAGDCYELGRLLYKDSKNEHMKYARAWLVEAFRKYRTEEMFYPFGEVDILEHISMACSRMGDMDGALRWTRVLLDVDPEHSQAKEVLVYLEELLAKDQQKQEGGELTGEVAKPDTV